MNLRFTLLACCLCLSVHCWAEDQVESAVESEYNQAYEQWALGLTHHLTDLDSPIVNILGSWLLDSISKDYPVVAGKSRQVRATALEKGWSEPAVVLKVYLADCVHGELADWCDLVTFQTQLRKLDPTNAAMVTAIALSCRESSAKRPIDR